VRLYREVRFVLPLPDASSLPSRITNSWAGTHEGGAAGPFCFLRATVEGPIDERSGYLCDIKRLDELLRGPVAARLAFGSGSGLVRTKSIADGLAVSMVESAGSFTGCVRLVELEAGMSPFTRLTVRERDLNMVYLTQAFEFSAAHRLYCPDRSDEENRRIFGKCSNPHGHGHNYVLEVTVAGEPVDRPGTVVDIGHVDRVVRERVVGPLDHKNLNTECEEFASMNPTVENIARVIWKRLSGAWTGCRLARVRVWETAKTYAEYCGE